MNWSIKNRMEGAGDDGRRKTGLLRSAGIAEGCFGRGNQKAFKTMARKYHPDLHPGDKEAEAKFKEVNEAYGVLSDADKRARYDQFGHAGVDPNFAGAGGGAGDFGGFGDMGDIFESIFGGFGGFGGGGGRSAAANANAPRRAAIFTAMFGSALWRLVRA